jgi:peptidase A4-like protein
VTSSPAGQPQIGGVYDNDHWAGYGVGGLDSFSTDFASVGATWTVPRVTCIVGEVTGSSIWVGLGGINAQLEQIATEADCDGLGSASYFGAYQMFGLPGWGDARRVTDPVEPGDQISAAVGYYRKADGTGVYDLVMRNLTRGWYFHSMEIGSTDVSAHNTAEWIVEAPRTTLIQSLSNFGTVAFSSCSADGKSINSWPGYRFNLTQPAFNNIHKARPAALKPGGVAFDVNWSAL